MAETQARVFLLAGHGELVPGQLFRHESVIGSQFDARVEATTTVGPYDAVVPSIAGRAWITSFNQLVLDPTDRSGTIANPHRRRHEMSPVLVGEAMWTRHVDGARLRHSLERKADALPDTDPDRLRYSICAREHVARADDLLPVTAADIFDPEG